MEWDSGGNSPATPASPGAQFRLGCCRCVDLRLAFQSKVDNSPQVYSELALSQASLHLPLFSQTYAQRSFQNAKEAGISPSRTSFWFLGHIFVFWSWYFLVVESRWRFSVGSPGK